MTDQKIIEQLKSDNSRLVNEALIFIQKSYKQTIVRFVMKNSGDVMDAEDLYSETIHALYQNITKLDTYYYSSSIKHYLFKIAEKTWLYTLRKRKKQLEITSEHLDKKVAIITEDTSKYKTLSKEQLRNFVIYIQENIGSNCYQLLKYKYVKNKRYEDILLVFEEYKNTNTLKSKMNKCKNQAKKKLINFYSTMQ